MAVRVIAEGDGKGCCLFSGRGMYLSAPHEIQVSFFIG